MERSSSRIANLACLAALVLPRVSAAELRPGVFSGSPDSASADVPLPAIPGGISGPTSQVFQLKSGADQNDRLWFGREELQFSIQLPDEVSPNSVSVGIRAYDAPSDLTGRLLNSKDCPFHSRPDGIEVTCSTDFPVTPDAKRLEITVVNRSDGTRRWSDSLSGADFNPIGGASGDAFNETVSVERFPGLWVQVSIGGTREQSEALLKKASENPGAVFRAALDGEVRPVDAKPNDPKEYGFPLEVLEVQRRRPPGDVFLVFMIDGSGSKIGGLGETAQKINDYLVPELRAANEKVTVHYAVVLFGQEVVDATNGFTTDFSEFESALAGGQVARGGSSVNQALAVSAELLEKALSSQDGSAGACVAFTDGMANDRDQADEARGRIDIAHQQGASFNWVRAPGTDSIPPNGAILSAPARTAGVVLQPGDSPALIRSLIEGVLGTASIRVGPKKEEDLDPFKRAVMGGRKFAIELASGASEGWSVRAPELLPVSGLDPVKWASETLADPKQSLPAKKLALERLAGQMDQLQVFDSGAVGRWAESAYKCWLTTAHQLGQEKVGRLEQVAKELQKKGARQRPGPRSAAPLPPLEGSKGPTLDEQLAGKLRLIQALRDALPLLDPKAKHTDSGTGFTVADAYTTVYNSLSEEEDRSNLSELGKQVVSFLTEAAVRGIYFPTKSPDSVIRQLTAAKGDGFKFTNFDPWKEQLKRARLFAESTGKGRAATLLEQILSESGPSSVAQVSATPK